MKSKIIKEFDTELKMRRKVWPRIYGEPETFVKPEHNDRYKALNLAKSIFESMTDAEFAKYTLRITTKPDDQPTLF